MHGQVAHPDPFSAAMEAVHDERVDEIVVSTFEPLKLRLAARPRRRAAAEGDRPPVEHVVVEKSAAEVPA